MRITLILLVLLITSNQGAVASDENSYAQKAAMDHMLQQLDAFITEQTEADVFSGTVLLSKDGETLYSTARGLASKRFNVPNNLQTKFNLGSMNKMFTSVAVMQLLEKGKISLDDTINIYVGEDWLPIAVTKQIQIQHLLTHASGLGSYFTREFMEHSKRRYRKLADFKPLVQGDIPQFTPGTSYRYSNTGMLLLGVIVEAASGQSYFDYVREHIYRPSEMVNSDCYEMDQPIPNLAIGYHRSPESNTGWVNNYYLHVVKGGPAGGCFSTVEDLQNFAEALSAHTLLSKVHTEQLFTPQSEFHTENYGFGFRIEGTEQNRIVGHSGGFMGISANLDIFSEQGYVAVVLSNYSRAARPIKDKIRVLLEDLE